MIVYVVIIWLVYTTLTFGHVNYKIMLDQPFLYCCFLTIVTITSFKITCDNNIITTHEIPSAKPIPFSLRKDTRSTQIIIVA